MAAVQWTLCILSVSIGSTLQLKSWVLLDSVFNHVWKTVPHFSSSIYILNCYWVRFGLGRATSDFFSFLVVNWPFFFLANKLSNCIKIKTSHASQPFFVSSFQAIPTGLFHVPWECPMSDPAPRVQLFHVFLATHAWQQNNFFYVNWILELL